MIKGYGTWWKGEDFKLKGFLKGQNAEYFEKSKGCQPVSHFNLTLKSHKECIRPQLNTFMEGPFM